jgi:hypothetical protein
MQESPPEDPAAELLDGLPLGQYLLELRDLCLIVWRIPGDPLDDVEPAENWVLTAA